MTSHTGAAAPHLATTGIEDDLVSHNTRLPYRLRRALELAATSGVSLQDLTARAVREFLETHYPEALAAVGSQQAETEVAARYIGGAKSR